MTREGPEQTATTLDTPEPSDARRAHAQGGALLVRLVSADQPAAPSARYFIRGFREVALQRRRGETSTPAGARLEIGLDDRFASSAHALLREEGGEWTIRDLGSRNGTLVNGRPLAEGELRPLGRTALLELGHTFFWWRAYAELPAGTPAFYEPAAGEGEPATLSPEWAHELQRAERLAPTDHELLLHGESGVGKEVLARHIHALSRPRGPLVGLNCGSVPEQLLEDELFGHVKGAFSGAQVERTGLLRAAQGGTLFLDEIGDMPAPLQIKLLRVLEDHRVRPIGTEREEAVNVRVIAATHRELERLVVEGKFRQDLLARIGLVPIRIPPMRARREDLGLLLRAVLTAEGALDGTVFECSALRALLLYDWPLNVRELRKVVGSAAALARAEGTTPAVVTSEHLPRLQPAAPLGPSASAMSKPPLDEEERGQRERIEALLEEHRGNLAAVARALGCTRSLLQRRLARFGLDPARHRVRMAPNE